jgi:Flp pilus assembly protein TadB
MELTILIAVDFALIIFLVLLVLINLDDRRAAHRLRAHLLRDEDPQSSPWYNRWGSFLDALSVPRWFSQILDDQTLIWSGIGMTGHQFHALWWLLSLLGVILAAVMVGFGFGTPVLGFLGFALVLFFVSFPYIYIKRRIRERERIIERTLPDFLDMLTFTIEAGLGLVPALKRVASSSEGVLNKEVEGALLQIELGFSQREALMDLSWRVPSPDVEHFVEAILLSERLGTSLARTMRVQTSLLRSRRRQRAEVKAQTAPIRIIPALVFFFLPSLLLIYLAPPIINFLLRR